MNRKIATALASAALLASVSVSAALAGAQTPQSEQPAAAPAPKIERTGRKQTKVVQTSCPVHPEVKARTGKCPKCRAEERQQNDVKQRGQKVRQRPQPQQGGEDANE